MTSTARSRCIAVLSVIAWLAGCSPSGEVRITDGRVTIPPPGMAMSAGYFTIENDSDATVEVRGISSDAFGSIEMHETRTANGVSSMQELPQLSIPPHGRVTFEPGGKHLMMFKPKAALEPGTRVAVAFKLAAPGGKESKVEATFVAREPGGKDHGH